MGERKYSRGSRVRLKDLDPDDYIIWETTL